MHTINQPWEENRKCCVQLTGTWHDPVSGFLTDLPLMNGRGMPSISWLNLYRPYHTTDEHTHIGLDHPHRGCGLYTLENLQGN